MRRREFSLAPFPTGTPLPSCRITGSLARRGDTLSVHYHLQGDLAELAIPAPAASPARRHRLWGKTCFEFFLGVKGQPQYWEFNLSPAGHWNVYGFADYRQGMAEETAIAALPVEVQRRREALLLTLEAPLAGIVAVEHPLAVGVAAVIQLAGGGLTYWALRHPGSQPDFHRRDSFLLEL